MAGIMIDNKFQSKLNSLITKTVQKERKMEGNLDFLFNNNVNQTKKNDKKKENEN